MFMHEAICSFADSAAQGKNATAIFCSALNNLGSRQDDI